MHWWSLTETLSNPNDPSLEFLAISTLGDNVHPNRIKTFLLAREALAQCLSKAGNKVRVSDLKVINHREILSHPQYTLSLSHSKTFGAAIIAERDKYISVGIDIEPLERRVNDVVFKRVSHPKDEKLRKIELWCLKEAVFKSLMNSGKFAKPLEFSSIHIGQNSWSHSPSGLEGEWLLDEINSLVLARAFLKN